jgi:predicted AAA+ superfamily ATPase
MAAAYFLLITHFWRARSATNSQSNDKKVFFGDPLLYTLTRDRAPGLPFDQPALVENCVGLALLRRYQPQSRLIESFLAPDQLHIWQTAKGKEIDFVCGPRSAPDVVEVKYQTNPRTSAASAAARAHPGRPVIMATKDALSLGPTYSLIPTHTLLWALG